MKKILAIILTVAMLLGVVVFNASADVTDRYPTVTLVTNSGSPLDINGKVAQDGHEYIFTVRFDTFILIRGIDITIDAGEAEITKVETFNLPTAVEGRNEFDENWRYLNNDNKSSIRFVDLNITSKSRIVLSVKTPQNTNFDTQDITVTGKYADTGETLMPIITKSQKYEIMEYVENKEDRINEEIISVHHRNKTNNDFLPYGSIYTKDGNTYTYYDKNPNGTFENITAGSYAIKFPLPRYDEGKNGKIINQLTTFGITEPIEVGNDPWIDEAHDTGIIKMGSYTTYDDYDDGSTKNKHGTLVFAGDWLSLKHYYIKQGNTVQQFVRAIFKQITESEKSGNTNNVDDPSTYHHFTYTVPKWDSEDPNEKVHVRVYKFPRVKYMWRDDQEYTIEDPEKHSTNGGEMEYAVRLHNAEGDQNYTAVAYCLEYDKTVTGYYNLDQVQISYNVKSFGNQSKDNAIPNSNS